MQNAGRLLIAAVGKRPNDEIELLLDIHNADHVFDWHLEIKDSAAGRARVTNIRKGIEHCLKLIESHPWIKEIAGPYQLSRLLTAVRVHERWQKSVLRERNKRRGKGLREATAVEWLIGVSLAKVYEKRFGPPTWRRDEDGKPQGPVIDFIEATTAALNLHCSRELIGRALTRLSGAVKFVNDELGIPLKKSTFDKKAMKGETPPPVGYYGKQELHTRKNIREWALAALRSDRPVKLGTA
jgi:hypothetical protein